MNNDPFVINVYEGQLKNVSSDNNDEGYLKEKYLFNFTKTNIWNDEENGDSIDLLKNEDVFVLPEDTLKNEAVTDEFINNSNFVDEFTEDVQKTFTRGYSLFDNISDLESIKNEKQYDEIDLINNNEEDYSEMAQSTLEENEDVYHYDTQETEQEEENDEYKEKNVYQPETFFINKKIDCDDDEDIDNLQGTSNDIDMTDTIDTIDEVFYNLDNDYIVNDEEYTELSELEKSEVKLNLTNDKTQIIKESSDSIILEDKIEEETYYNLDNDYIIADEYDIENIELSEKEKEEIFINQQGFESTQDDTQDDTQFIEDVVCVARPRKLITLIQDENQCLAGVKNTKYLNYEKMQIQELKDTFFLNKNTIIKNEDKDLDITDNSNYNNDDEVLVELEDINTVENALNDETKCEKYNKIYSQLSQIKAELAAYTDIIDSLIEDIE